MSTDAHIQTKRWKLTVQAALAPAVWGSTYLVTTELLPAGRPLLDSVTRALPAGLVLLAPHPDALPTGSWWWRSLVLGTLNIGAFNALLFVAAYRLPGGIAATLIAFQPLAVAVLAVGLLGERLSTRRLLAGLAGVVGVGLLVLRSDAELDAVGITAALGAAASMATGVVLTQRWGRPGGVLPFAAWQLTAGGLVIAPVALAIEGGPPGLSATNLAGYAYLSLIGAALTYPLWFRGIAQLSAPVASFLGLLSPLVAALLGAAVLGEGFTPWQSVGFVIVLASILAGQLAKREHRAVPPEALNRPMRAPGTPRPADGAADSANTQAHAPRSPSCAEPS
ncbi:MAG: EamA family transporter [Geodermatophilaceae bacterium]